MKLKYGLLFCLISAHSLYVVAQKKDVFSIENNSIPISEKEAILILPGFGSKIHGVKHIKNFFSHKGYDLFIPHLEFQQFALWKTPKAPPQYFEQFSSKKYLKSKHNFPKVTTLSIIHIFFQRSFPKGIYVYRTKYQNNSRIPKGLYV